MKMTTLFRIATASVCAIWPLYLLAADPDTKTSELQEIVVTAQKRVEDLDKVPISISVFDRTLMEQRGIQDINDIANISPGVDYEAQGPINRLAIRGISSPSGYATVGTYIDDIPVQLRNSPVIGLEGAVEPKVFDLDRVEVLRGPQGTLFGAGAEGGAIRFITPQPSLTDYSGYSRAGIGITDSGGPSYESGVAVGGPIITDELGFRVSVWHRRDGGYIDHDSAVPGGYQYDHSNWSDSDVVRAALTYAPAASLKITPSLYFQHVYSHDMPDFEPAGSKANVDPFTTYMSVLGPQYSNVGEGRFINPAFEQTPSRDQFYLPALKTVLDFAEVELTSSTSYMNRVAAIYQDFSTVVSGVFQLPWQTTPAAADHNFISTNQNVVSQELRLQNVDTSLPFQWTFGLYYTKSRQTIFNLERSPYLPTLIQTYFGMPIQDVLESALLPGNVSTYAPERATDTQAAGFGQVTYQVLTHLSMTAGARIAHETSQYSLVILGPFAAPYFSGGQSERVIDPKFGINIQLDDNNLLYVSAAKGDRIGGINTPFIATSGCTAGLAALGLSTAPSTYQGDSLWSYEFGSKSRLFNGRMEVEASVFHIDWSNIQESVYIPACGEGFISNLGKAVSNGFDLATNILVTDDLKVGLSLGYTDAKSANTITVGATQYATNGDQINSYSAPWTVAPSAEYTFAFGGKYKGYVRLDDEFRSKNPGPFPEQHPINAAYDPDFIPNPSTNQLNIHVGTTWGGWDVSLYALNALNSHPLLYNGQLEEVQPVGAAYTIRPLTMGIVSAFRW